MIIKEQKFIDLYANLLILNEFNNDTISQFMTESLLDSAGVTSMQIDSTIKFYSKKPEDWSEIMRRIRDRIKELRSRPLNLDSLKNDYR